VIMREGNEGIFTVDRAEYWRFRVVGWLII
jgi:hypothetical protein